jgi:EmrB/QacA subfamily drug resistance transporter
LLLMCVATFMIQLDVTVVNVALPRIQTGLGMTPGGLEWVIGAYALSLAALIPVGGALGDHYGRKRVFLVGMAVFALASTACALSTTPAMLIAARAVQGVGGAAMLALTLSIVAETFPAANRAAAIGTWAAVGGTGFGVGPVAGGVLLTFFGWASVFWINLPFAVVGLIGTAVVVPESRNPQSRRLDRLGVVLSAAGLVAVTLGLVESSAHPWTSELVAVPVVVGIALLVAFAMWQRRTPHAMVPPQLLRARRFVVAAVVYLVSYTALSATLFYVSLLYQDVVGWSVLRTGLSWLFMNAPFLVMAQLAGRLERRLPPAIVVGGGCSVGAIGIAVLARAGISTPFALTAVGYALAGAGFGTLVPRLTHVAMSDVPSGVSGAASAVLTASRQIGTSVGLAVLGAIGVSATISDWAAKVDRFPAPIRATARAQAETVAGARMGAVVTTLGPSYRRAAGQAFAHGYHLAVGAGAGCLLLAAAVAAFGFRPRPTSARRWRRATGRQPAGEHQYRERHEPEPQSGGLRQRAGRDRSDDLAHASDGQDLAECLIGRAVAGRHVQGGGEGERSADADARDGEPGRRDGRVGGREQDR